ncbi:MAG: UrcA family protein [Pseudomonadota bacterium]
MRKTFVAGASALALAVIAVPAATASPSSVDAARISVSFADLNIDSEAGARALYSRLQQASASVCNKDSLRELGSLAAHAKAEACYDETLDEAVAEVGSKTLSKIHAS